MLAVPFYPYRLDFIFQLGYIARVTSNITLLLMSALLGYCRRNGGVSLLLKLNNYLYDFTSHYEGILTVTLYAQDGWGLRSNLIKLRYF
jgi:hypothetical protein